MSKLQGPGRMSLEDPATTRAWVQAEIPAMAAYTVSVLISEPLGVHASLGALDHILHTTCWMKLHHLWDILKKPCLPRSPLSHGSQDKTCPERSLLSQSRRPGSIFFFFVVLPCAYGA